eukprot:scaffold80334_cov48-Phaeocystis_antarctica.AAC.2
MHMRRAHLVGEVVHEGADLDEHEHGECEEGEAEDDAEEEQVRRADAEHARHQRHLGQDDVCELDDLEQLDVDAHGRIEARLCVAPRTLRMQMVCVRGAHTARTWHVCRSCAHGRVGWGRGGAPREPCTSSYTGRSSRWCRTSPSRTWRRACRRARPSRARAAPRAT